MKRYESFVKHLKVLERAEEEDLENEFIISGIIDKFFLQFELGWKILKEIMRYEGRAAASSGSPREIIKASYSCCAFMDEEIWLSMLKSRNDLAHMYDEQQAKRLVETILTEYIPEFRRMVCGLENRYGDELRQM